MATGRGLRRWTDGRPRQALQAASGELRVGIEGSRCGEGVAYETREYKQAGGRTGGQTGKPTAQIKPK